MESGGVVDLKAFVPAKEFALAKQFYVDLGFMVKWESPEIAEMEVGEFRFLLQNYYVKEFAENFMMQLMVEDVDVWWGRIEEAGIVAKYPGITAKGPAVQPWGLRVLFLSDPSGVLWHIADRLVG